MNDVSWCPTTPYLAASVDEDNVFMVWQFNADICFPDDDTDAGDDAEHDDTDARARDAAEAEDRASKKPRAA